MELRGTGLPRMIFAAGLVVAAGLAYPLAAQQIVVSKDNRTIAVTTSASATAEADRATIHIGFVAYGPDRATAYATGSEVSSTVAGALKGAGLPQDAIESEDQRIGPVRPYAGPEWTPQQKAERQFEVQQSWAVTTTAKNAAEILDLAVKAGANQSGEIDWTVSDDDSLQAQAAALALERARQIALRMAKGLGAILGPLVYASNEAPARGVQPLVRFSSPLAATASGAGTVEPLSIQGRKVTRSATVYAVFAIQ